MIRLRRAPASPALRGVCRGYEQRYGDLLGAGVVISLAARPHQFIEIYVGDPYLASIDGAAFAVAPSAVVVGPQTRRRADLLIRGRVEAFNIQFQPTGFHRLFGLSMTTLTDHAEASADVADLNGLTDAVRVAANFESRVAVTEAWLAARLDRVRGDDAVDHAARLLRRVRGAARIDVLAARSGLGPRQFHRRFLDQVGVAPKLYGRIARFDALLADRHRSPSVGWTELAHAHGYFDHAHMLKDFRGLAGATPSSFPLFDIEASR
ncbi:helix-turn-helix domain-containing protein [Brevundimonas sp.]|uniref:helix-turn-helix domain-containing protein n=1 Tax=Brevundimonas sp. TaxID=1871086 RepID=UPI00356461C8